MKNKTKKILAGFALGLTGMATLTGCSGLTVDQQNQIDSALSKVDTLIDVMEEQTTTNLTKEGAYSKLLFAQNQLLKFDLPKIKCSTKSTIYDNCFIKKETLESTFISYFSNNIEKFVSQGSDDISYAKKNFNNGKAYKYIDYVDNDKNDVYEEYNNFLRKNSEFEDDSESARYGQFLAYYGRSYITGSLAIALGESDIISFNFDDNKLKIKMFGVYDFSNSFCDADIVIENDLITSIYVNIYEVTEDRFNILKDLSYFEIINNIYSSDVGNVLNRHETMTECDYSDFDTSEYDAKFAEIESVNAV